MNCDWNVEDVTANDSSNPSPAKFQRLINDTNTIVFWIHWLVPKAMGLKLNFDLKDFQQCDSQKVFQLD